MAKVGGVAKESKGQKVRNNERPDYVSTLAFELNRERLQGVEQKSNTR